MTLKFNPPVSFGEVELDELRTLNRAGISPDKDIISEYHTQFVTNLLRENTASINTADITG